MKSVWSVLQGCVSTSLLFIHLCLHICRNVKLNLLVHLPFSPLLGSLVIMLPRITQMPKPTVIFQHRPGPTPHQWSGDRNYVFGHSHLRIATALPEHTQERWPGGEAASVLLPSCCSQHPGVPVHRVAPMGPLVALCPPWITLAALTRRTQKTGANRPRNVFFLRATIALNTLLHFFTSNKM